jgi:hypothetical protein
MTEIATLAVSNPASLTTSASRRSWLKGLGALFGSGLLAAAPTAAFASPALATAEPLPSSSLVGGDEYIGIVKLMAGTVVPAGWLACEGQLLPVAEHPALFAIVGTTYGGDGRRTFALPDLRESATAGTGPTADAPMRAQHCAIKVANAPAALTALAELRLRHHPYRSA